MITTGMACTKEWVMQIMQRVYLYRAHGLHEAGIRPSPRSVVHLAEWSRRSDFQPKVQGSNPELQRIALQPYRECALRAAERTLRALQAAAGCRRPPCQRALAPQRGAQVKLPGPERPVSSDSQGRSSRTSVLVALTGALPSSTWRTAHRHRCDKDGGTADRAEPRRDGDVHANAGQRQRPVPSRPLRFTR
ncbi:Polyphosphatidylinositol phosphatase INP52 [Frankliniella fusca]|uniref:Polyphosphatidylinositol phosphatase INP52 n=1 Tax=Frankliniella fusca TaxID=407009 RepID=A0AAE1HV02_9NEOP|nr:Polyphosphatidylinositol phosphatase INP52 [Frankliniella fusca]